MSTSRKHQAEDEERRERAQDEEPGSNAVEYESDPDAKPIADGEHQYLPRSPYTTGNY